MAPWYSASRFDASEMACQYAEMLLSSMQIANYEYGFYWYFYNEGHIEHEVKLTGCLSTNLLSPGEGPNPTHGTLMAPGLNAQVTCLTSCLCAILLVNHASRGIGEHLIINAFRL